VQRAATVAAILPTLPAATLDAIRGGGVTTQGEFSNKASAFDLGQGHVSQWLGTARTMGAAVAAARATFAPCMGAVAPPGADCLGEFVAAFGARVFRRPLEADERSEMTAFLSSEIGKGVVKGVEQLAARLFMHPFFLHRSELGNAAQAGASGTRVTLTPHERASALSYLLLDGPPDAELMAAAARGGLANADEISAQARRLLDKGVPGAGLARFLEEHFHQYERVLPVTKDTKIFAEWKDAGMAGDLMRETEALFSEALKSAGRLDALLTADFGFVTPRVAALYGVPTPAGARPDEARRVTFPAGQRSGILTQGSLMAVFSDERHTDIVNRGRFVREQLLCQALPPPPDTVDATFPMPTATRTRREQLTEHSSNPQCTACHKLMDPIGYAFERIDAAGRYRMTEAGKSIDSTGVVLGLDGADARIADAPELGRVLARSQTVHACMTQRMFQYVHGRDAGAADGCALSSALAAFKASQLDLRELAVALVAHDSFVTRQY
jgi:hypothetical protein